ncbi:hypothetical protein GMDG_05863 [Pseudogymnoascus destructans 20631-21]|uniref:Uncharacterized protein n=2 Tax=Pseudogymnoascus destructans TaxID=655981 RepID=L8FRB2_PSED2|nr:hypothetical protein GMDG_05863 [Pseudogymnoascus destructans 20631-21]
MVFTLVIWVFAALSLLLAMLFYLLFLWHYIPNGDGGLSGYCERKINGRLQKIVSVKINKAIEDEERKRIKGNQKAFKNGEKPTLGRQATLPTLFDTKDDKLPTMPMLNRNDTTTTLPMYTSRPGTPSSLQPKLPDFELSNMDQKRPVPSRLNTATSASSYGASSSLVANAAGMGYSRSGSPAPPMPGQEGSNGVPFPAPQRTMTGGTNASQGSSWAQQQRVPQQLRSGPAPLKRQGTQDSYGSGMGNGNGGGFGPPARQMTEDSYNSYNPPSRNMTPFDRVASPMDRSMGNNTPFDRVGSPMDRSMGGNTPLARIASPMDRSMGNNTPITRTDSPLSYTSRPGQNYTPAPSALSQDPYAPQRNNQQSQNHDSYDPYSTASPTRATHGSGIAMDDEPTLPSFDAPTIVAPPRSDTPSSHYVPSIASIRGAGDGYARPGPSLAGQNGQTRYGRSTPSQGSIESSVGRRTPAFDTSDRSNGNMYASQQQQGRMGMGVAPPTGSYAQPVRSASAGVGQQQQYARPPPERNMTEPGGGYNAYGGGGGGGGGGGYRQ